MGRLPLLAKPGQFYPVVDIMINTKGDITKTNKFCDISLLNNRPLVDNLFATVMLSVKITVCV